MKKEHKKISKFLSLILRHRPEVVGLVLDEEGWVATNLLLKQLNLNGHSITLEILQEVVAQNNKKRFAFSADGQKIRANQGHSIAVNLGYNPVVPPEVLFHGTAEKFIGAIQKQGLIKKKRHHVHLSANVETATQVGARHGKVVLLQIKALEMHQAGFAFFISDNGVWLTDSVPVEYINFEFTQHKNNL